MGGCVDVFVVRENLSVIHDVEGGSDDEEKG